MKNCTFTVYVVLHRLDNVNIYYGLWKGMQTQKIGFHSSN